jgi:hypothetical protein
MPKGTITSYNCKAMAREEMPTFKNGSMKNKIQVSDSLLNC